LWRLIKQAKNEARLIELDPKYVDVIVRRWQEFAGGVATRVSDGAPFGGILKEQEMAVQT
jgi:hypothetical protein